MTIRIFDTPLAAEYLVPLPALLHFESLEKLRTYLKGLLEWYEKEADSYSAKIASMMRAQARTKRDDRTAAKLSTQNWRKIGSLHINQTDPLLGTLDILLEALDDYKLQISRTYEVLKVLEEL